MQKIRLDKFVSVATGLSRTQARKAILGKLVYVDGELCRKIDTSVTTDQAVKYNAKTLVYQEFVYIMLNKPKGVLSAVKDKNDQTVVDIVAADYPNRDLFPAGRLDKDSEGFVLITDDGGFAHNILSPKKHISKTYIVTVDGILTDKVVQGFKDGVVLADGERMKPAVLEILQPNEAKIVITQGVYHQVKRMLGVFSLGVNDLKRISMGDILLDPQLKLGEFREITKNELENMM